MNTASLENSKRLYELSGWNTENHWYIPEPKTNTPPYPVDKPYDPSIHGSIGNRVPAYDAGYLLRRLPNVIQDPHDKIFRHFQMWMNGDGSIHAGCVEPYAHDDRVAYAQVADTPEDALCLLAIKLFEEDTL